MRHRRGGVAWMYTIAGLASALVAAASALAAQRIHRHAPLTMLVGSAGFAAASFLAGYGGQVPRPTPAAHASTFAVIMTAYVCYGLGVAAWQGSCMALIGDLFRDDPRARLRISSSLRAFAALLASSRCLC